ncbi:MAG: hypothetical protein M3160_00115 [Candidatus Eremiobacteraeota bacterium]|nr:hypothetical protein [Candidatus Eremiobacteraeota bacterium]
MFAFARAALALSFGIVLPIAAQTPAHAGSSTRHKPPRYSVSQLYSSRARHRAITILQLKLLELHEEHLDRLRRIIVRKLPIDTLLKADRPRV